MRVDRGRAPGEIAGDSSFALSDVASPAGGWRLAELCR